MCNLTAIEIVMVVNMPISGIEVDVFAANERDLRNIFETQECRLYLMGKNSKLRSGFELIV